MAEPETKNAADEEGDEEVTDLSNSDVTTKYQEAAKIVNLALQGVVQQCVAGASVTELCKFGDTVIEQRCAQMFRGKVKGKPVDKGVAFPTCVSVNECVCHNNPLASEADAQRPLAEGDIVKVDLGCHIDGYIAVAAHTVKVGAPATAEAPLTGREADVMLAAVQAAEVAARVIKPGNKNTQVTEAVKKVAEAYGVQLLLGTTMQQLKRYVIDGSKQILVRGEPEQKVEACTFEPNEVYAIDIAVSSGEGKPREQGTRTTVFKRAVDKTYRLKMKASRYLVSEVNTRFPTLPFCLRAFEDEKQARMGVVECVKHELLQPYAVLYERPGDVVAHIKFTVLLLPSGTVKVTGLEVDPATLRSDKALDAESTELLAQELGGKKKKRKKKKKSGAGAGDADGEAEAEEGGDDDA